LVEHVHRLATYKHTEICQMLSQQDQIAQLQAEINHIRCASVDLESSFSTILS
jgi:hypothetical protein